MKLVISLALLIITLGIVQTLSLPQIDTVQVYDAYVEVASTTGFALNSTAFNFGKVRPDGAQKKELNIVNTGDDDLFVKIIATGNISQGLEINKNNFYLLPDELAKIFVTFKGKNLDYGHYEGQIIVTTYS